MNAQTAEQTAAQARQLSEWLAATDIAILELTGPGQVIRLRRTAGDGITTEISDGNAQDGEAQDSHDIPATVVRAGSVGVVLHAHPLRDEPLVRAGQRVSAGQALVLLQVGKVLLPVCAPRDATVIRHVADHHSVAGYGTPLVELE